MKLARNCKLDWDFTQHKAPQFTKKLPKCTQCRLWIAKEGLSHKSSVKEKPSWGFGGPCDGGAPKKTAFRNV